jgi:hypothetical protein
VPRYCDAPSLPLELFWILESNSSIEFCFVIKSTGSTITTNSRQLKKKERDVAFRGAPAQQGADGWVKN